MHAECLRLLQLVHVWRVPESRTDGLGTSLDTGSLRSQTRKRRAWKTRAHAAPESILRLVQEVQVRFFFEKIHSLLLLT